MFIVLHMALSDENAALVNFLCDFYKNKDVIAQGDFNLLSSKWKSDPSLFCIAPNDYTFFNM